MSGKMIKARSHREWDRILGTIEIFEAVAGHGGTLRSENGKYFIKPCTRAEMDFYEAVDGIEGRHDLAKIMPVCIGQVGKDYPPLEKILAREAKKQSDDKAKKQSDDEPRSSPQGKPIKNPDTWAVLEDTSHHYEKPNVLDVKLGVKLYDDKAANDKRERFDRMSAYSTHGSKGFRISGMRTYQGRQFESRHPEDRPQCLDPHSHLDENGYITYHKDFGHITVNTDNVVSALQEFIFNETAGINENLGKAVCSSFIQELEQIHKVLRKHDTRMFSVSLLFTFEGDGKALDYAFKKHNEARKKIAALKENNAVIKKNNAAIEKNNAAIEKNNAAIEKNNAAIKTNREIKKRHPICTLKLIDFAHTVFLPGGGADDNIIMGVTNLIKIFQDMAAQKQTS
ncbi:inositol polyphosphate kinase domain-containing protein [Trichoderma austrokoningii]